MRQTPIRFQQVSARGRHVIAQPAPQRSALATWFRQRAVRQLTYSVAVHARAATVAYARGDLKAFRAFAQASRELAMQRDAILDGAAAPFDATDIRRVAVFLVVLFWLGFFSFLFN